MSVTISERAEAVMALHEELERITVEQLALAEQMAKLVASQVRLASRAGVLHKTLGIFLGEKA